MPRKLTAFNEAQKMVAEANRSMGLTRSSPNRALSQRPSKVKESSRSQRFRLSDEDSSDSDEEDDSQGTRRVSQWFAPRGKGKEKEVVEVEDDEGGTAGTQIRVKAERRNSQSASTRRGRGGASMIPDASAVIDLTLQSSDDETPKATTQKPKPPYSTLASNSKASGSQRSTADGKAAVNRAKKTTPGRKEAEKARLKRMMSGGSGKSEGDSIVLLDTDEEDVPCKTVVQVSSLAFLAGTLLTHASSSESHRQA